ncbi:MAG: amidohydrolase [Steroidobacteraceae bacterium]
MNASSCMSRAFDVAASAALLAALTLLVALPQRVAAAELAVAANPELATILASLDDQVIAWRRDLHQNPELSNREFRTSKLVAEHLRKLGLKVQTGIAHTGVVGLLEGGKPGPTIALRADMDGLPVTEQVDVPFKSKVTTTYRGETVGVMHACGHDSHTAVLMGVAEAFTRMRADLPGKVLFIFQPAEEGAPAGEHGGASLMLEEGVFDLAMPEAVFGLHVMSTLKVGTIGYRGGPLMAGSDSWRIVVQGRQTHGARPWGGIDPIVISAQIINALQTVVSRQVDITENPAVVTVGAIKGGIRNNIVPDEVEMIGTIRTFDIAQRQDIIERMQRIVEKTAAASGTTATFAIDPGGNPVVLNNNALTEAVVPSLRKAAADVRTVPLVTGAEDFAYYAQKVPSFFFFVGVTPADQNPVTAPSNHSPLFYIDEAGIPIASRALANVAYDYLLRGAATTKQSAAGN